MDNLSHIRREEIEDSLIAAALNNPDEFNLAVLSVFDDIDDELGAMTSKSVISNECLDFDLSIAEESCDIEFNESKIELDDEDSVSPLIVHNKYCNLFLTAESERPTGMSNKKKKRILQNIPEKVSERFIKKNPECRKEIEEIIGSVSLQDLQQLFVELVMRQKGAMKIFDFTNLSAASEYELHVRQWDSATEGFDRKFHYCVFLRNSRGHEFPVKFQNHPAYCLYVMYAIDRAKRGDNASFLSLQANREAYIHLYQTIFGEAYDEAEKKYSTFAYRLNKDGEPTRKGRYDDYLKDIDETIVSLVGRADSIPLKLRDGGHIELLPEKIKIDEKLLSFEFA